MDPITKLAQDQDENTVTTAQPVTPVQPATSSPVSSSLSNDPGPYSALFDYKDEAAKEEARQAQLQDAQKKIMRTNAIGDAFRLLVDGIGGSQGATITPKTVNPGIISASNRLQALGKERDSNLERLRLTDMANKSKDIAYNQ